MLCHYAILFLINDDRTTSRVTQLKMYVMLTGEPKELLVCVDLVIWHQVQVSAYLLLCVTCLAGQVVGVTVWHKSKVKPGFHYPSWRVTGFHYLCWRTHVSTSRVDGPSTWLVQTARPSTRPVLTGNGNRSPVNSGSGNRTLVCPYAVPEAESTALKNHEHA